MAKDYYEILGVDRSASADDIKSAYRKLAKKYHPDMNQGNEDAAVRFKEINEAYQVLSDETKKRNYDTFGTADPGSPGSGGGSGPFGGYSPFGDSGAWSFQGDGFGFEDIIDNLFGGGMRSQRSSRGPSQGSSIRMQLQITFEEAAFGAKKEITYKRLENCAECGGTGAKPGSGTHQCDRCGGTGVIHEQQRSIFGSVDAASVCPECEGKGTVPNEKCSACKGQGTVRRQVKVSVDIPAGIDTGQTITIRGDGNASTNGGPPGDLLIVIGVKPSKLFERVGYDLLLNLKINMVQATLGDEVEVPTLDGRVRYEIPEGTQPGTLFRLKGKGIRHLRSKAVGDLYVRVDVAIPKRLNGRQKKLLNQFADKTKLAKAEFSKPTERF